ncbi:MAG: hypothetical protein GY847_42000 [Proteobacteria bacterium]|nr:hypothetical protein [Pseudomonadota bacterium]
MTNEPTFDMMSSSKCIPKEDWKPLEFEDTAASQEDCRKIVTEVLNRISGWRLSRRKWKKQGILKLTWKNGNGDQEELRTQFSDLVLSLRNKRHWSDGFPKIELCWMEKSIVASMGFYAPGNQPDPPSLTTNFPSTLGDKFPLSPKIDREGIAFSSFQTVVLKTIISSRKRLVENSLGMLSLDKQWFQDLITYLNSCVSIVEMTLHQIYYKGKYDGDEMGWNFDENNVGSPVNRRLTDKINWIHQITGKKLDNIASELQAFKSLKRVRNHLSHFDPPVFACSIEDVASWLNKAADIGRLIRTIRRSVRGQLSPKLIELILLPDVKYIPRDPGKSRLPQQPGMGYDSCVWPPSESSSDELPNTKGSIVLSGSDRTMKYSIPSDWSMDDVLCTFQTLVTKTADYENSNPQYISLLEMLKSFQSKL